MSILIIGSGFAGLCMGIRLKKARIEEFTILERAGDVGGTWRDNHYPGCACDVQSHLYSFSFEPNPNWSRMFASQAEIYAYLRHCADKYDLRRHIHFNQDVVRAEYDNASAMWAVHTKSGHQYRARVLISGMGGLCNPAYPVLAGVENFAGRSFHSAEWDHSYDLRGKRVAVIGTGASAIQFVPQIAGDVAQLDLYQRTPPWIVPKPDRPVTALERRLFKHVPITQRLMRSAIYCLLEARVFGFAFTPKLMIHAQRFARRHLEAQVKDPSLRKKLTPDYALGCKRVLISDDYYPVLERSNVELVTEPIREVRRNSIMTIAGRERPADAIIYGTGFKAQQFFPGGTIIGLSGQTLAEAWKDSIQAYKGTTVAGFPNLFLILGPNTGLGHSSMVYMIESQVAYIFDALRQMRANGWRAVDVKREVSSIYNQALQKKHAHAIWQSGCKSWYLDANGRNTALWPSSTFSFRRQTAEFDAQNYSVEPHQRASSFITSQPARKLGQMRYAERILK